MGAELDQEGGSLMMRKWKDTRGETLVEVLAAILIGSLSVALIFGAIMATTKMNLQAQNIDTSYYEVLSKAERQKPTEDVLEGATGFKITITGTPDETGSKSVEINNVTFYGGKGAISYVLNAPDPPAGGDTP